MFVNIRSWSSAGLKLLVVVLVAGMADPAPVRADNDGAAFLGGMMAGHVLSRFGEMQRRRNEELAMIARGGGGGYGGGHGGGYRSEQPAPAPQAPSMTPEQKLNQLDKLAAGGYITPAEYKERRQAILNTL